MNFPVDCSHMVGTCRLLKRRKWAHDDIKSNRSKRETSLGSVVSPTQNGNTTAQIGLEMMEQTHLSSLFSTPPTAIRVSLKKCSLWPKKHWDAHAKNFFKIYYTMPFQRLRAEKATASVSKHFFQYQFFFCVVSIYVFQ